MGFGAGKLSRRAPSTQPFRTYPQGLPQQRVSSTSEIRFGPTIYLSHPMSEWRKDPVGKDWVILAENRVDRPNEFETSHQNRTECVCPFCLGNEDQTPSEIAAYGQHDTTETKLGWQVRVVPNKYPALEPHRTAPTDKGPLFHSMPGVGAHEVIIETPRHIFLTSELTEIELKHTFCAYRDRLRHWTQHSDLAYGILFKNVGQIQSAPLGCGLEGVLRQRRNVLSGILNGVDYGEWDPATDGNLTATYDVHTVHQKKPLCKHALQKELNLPTTGRVPLVALIGRLAQQKGWDLIVPTIQEFVQTSPIQWVVLGTGDPIYHQQLELLAKQYPQQVAVRLEFSDRLAHIIEAGADMFLMPSQYEPCGLNQLYSLKYGTVPVVRTTGGLADSIVDTTSATLAAGTANGFRFEEYSKLSLSETLRRACDAYQKSDIWKPLIEIGMQQDWSWARSSREYSQLYQKTLAQHRQTVVA